MKFKAIIGIGMNTGYMEIDDSYYIRHIPTSKKVGYVKLRLSPREIPQPQTDNRTIGCNDIEEAESD